MIELFLSCCEQSWQDYVEGCEIRGEGCEIRQYRCKVTDEWRDRHGNCHKIRGEGCDRQNDEGDRGEERWDAGNDDLAPLIESMQRTQAGERGIPAEETEISAMNGKIDRSVILKSENHRNPCHDVARTRATSLSTICLRTIVTAQHHHTISARRHRPPPRNPHHKKN